VFPSLLRLLKTEGSSEDEVMLRVKGILAISALVRHSAPAQALFLQHQGAQLLGRLTADGDARVKRWVREGGLGDACSLGVHCLSCCGVLSSTLAFWLLTCKCWRLAPQQCVREGLDAVQLKYLCTSMACVVAGRP
jgi:hypothetical protein